MKVAATKKNYNKELINEKNIILKHSFVNGFTATD